jgi:colanic acid/amylovoran biosynthesis glycosyltransferase
MREMVPVVGYVVGLYPALTMTFVRREIDAVRQRDMTVKVVSIRRADGEHLLSEAHLRAAKSVRVIVETPVWRSVLAVIRVALQHPRSAAATVCASLRLRNPGLRSLTWRMFYAGEALLVWQWTISEGVDHLHAHLANVAADVAMLAAGLGRRTGRGAPSWSFTMHGPTEFYNVGFYRLREKVESATAVVCVSAFARSQLLAIADPRDAAKLHVIRCGVDPAWFARPAHHGRAHVVLTIARLVPEKGLAVLVDAVTRLHDIPQVRVLIVGSGSEEHPLRRMIATAGLADRILLLVPASEERITALLAGADVFCLPSLAEGVPVSLMEALAAGVPVVTTAVMGIPELVQHDVSGLLVPPGSAVELAGALRLMLTDADLRRRLADEGRDVVARDYNIAATGSRLSALFRRILAQ